MVRYDGDIVGIEPLNLVLLKVTFGFQYLPFGEATGEIIGGSVQTWRMPYRKMVVIGLGG